MYVITYFENSARIAAENFDTNICYVLFLELIIYEQIYYSYLGIISHTKYMKGFNIHF